MMAVSMIVVLGACSKSDNNAKDADSDDDYAIEKLAEESSNNAFNIATQGVQHDVQVLGEYLLKGARQISKVATIEEGDRVMDQFSKNAETELDGLDDNLVLTQEDRNYLAQCYTAFVGSSLLRVAELNGADVNDPEVEKLLDDQMEVFIDAISETLQSVNTLGEAAVAISNIME